jgi:hypothetical protein
MVRFSSMPFGGFQEQKGSDNDYICTNWSRQLLPCCTCFWRFPLGNDYESKAEILNDADFS